MCLVVLLQQCLLGAERPTSAFELKFPLVKQQRLEAESGAAGHTCWVCNGCVDANKVAVGVQQHPTRVTRIDGRISLRQKSGQHHVHVLSHAVTHLHLHACHTLAEKAA